MKTKSIFYLSILFISAFFTSCDNNDEMVNEPSNSAASAARTANQNIKLYDSIISIVDLQEQNIAVSSFDVETQVALWQLKYQNFESNNNLNSDQQLFMRDIKAYSTVDNFKKARLFDANVKRQAATFKSRALTLFGPDLGYYLLAKFENTNQTLRRANLTLASGTGGALSACNCASSSECKRLTGISIWGLAWENGNCGGSCYVDRYFFGLWESSNTGRCSY